MSRTQIVRAILGASISLAALAATPVHAQETAAADAGLVSDDIVVTAQKRNESAQNVPISITALGGDQLKAAGVSGTQDLKSVVPALNVTTGAGGFGLPRIRGIGATGQGVGIENPVVVYVDGVYYSAAFGVLQSVFDAKQVTVLKGPQGTLFGRNATGGLIQIDTLGPDFQWNGKAELGYGNFQTMTGGAYLSGPVSDTVAFSVSGQYENRDKGYGVNRFLNRDIGTNEQWSGRAKLLFQPSDATKVLLSADFNGRNAAEPAFRNFGLNSLGQDVSAQIVAAGGDPQHDIYSDYNPYMRAKQWGTGLTVEQDVGGATLKSISAYRRSDLLTVFDPDGTVSGGTQLLIANVYADKQFTEEVNLISKGSGPFKWVVGGFYMWDQGVTSPRPDSVRNSFAGNQSDTLADSRLHSIAGFVEGSYNLDPATRVTAGIRYTHDSRTLSVLQQSYTFATNTLANTPTVTDARTFERVTWKLSVDHRFSDQVLAYASYNRGFRSGTFIPQATPLLVLKPEVVDAYEVGLKTDLFDRKVRINVAGYRYDQTNVQVMQVIAGVQQVYNAMGARIYGLDGDISWKVTDHLRLFGGANWTHARYTSFTDAVISVPYPLSTSLGAAAASTFSTTNYTYIDSTTGQTVANTACLGTFLPPSATTQAARDAFYRGRAGGNCLLRGDASGKRLQNTPTITFSMGGTLDIPTEVGKFTFGGNVYYNGGFVGTPDERVQQAAYTTVDASLTWRHPNEKLYAKIWGRNLTDAFYRTQIGASNSGDNGTSAAPRTYGMTLGFDF
jgi:iron complex outermembrane receptor protein